ncbi:MAG TPA: LLM class flavin-dependent oxidoreductase [Stellaceae bacterium]|nr:LLM class flavin-dependent oxidoreductase [Stellaceae bacterium]
MILSVLDQSPVRAGGTAADAFNETIALAQATERWGFHRYWLAEHHATEGLAGAAPEIMIARVAAATSEMRVGSGGVMLSHYSPLKVAEQFRVLETLYPGRIDLGVGRAPGSDQMTARALQAGPGAIGAEYFPSQVQDLLGYLCGGLPADHPFARVRVTPEPVGRPEVWLLGSSDQSALVAAYLGCPFSFAHFITDQGGLEVMGAYRDRFRPSAQLAAPLGSIGVFVMCADTEAEAQRLVQSRDLWRLRLDQGYLGPVPSIAEAEAHDYTREERLRIAMNRRRMVIGAPEAVKARLVELAQHYGVNEIVAVTICHEFAPRLRSYELLAQAFELKPRAL